MRPGGFDGANAICPRGYVVIGGGASIAGPGVITFASIQLAEGVSIVPLSRAMGHHSPAFTLARYAHLLPGENAPALDLDDVLAATAADEDTLVGQDRADPPLVDAVA